MIDNLEAFKHYFRCTYMYMYMYMYDYMYMYVY